MFFLPKKALCGAAPFIRIIALFAMFWLILLVSMMMLCWQSWNVPKPWCHQLTLHLTPLASAFAWTEFCKRFTIPFNNLLDITVSPVHSVSLLTSASWISTNSFNFAFFYSICIMTFMTMRNRNICTTIICQLWYQILVEKSLHLTSAINK